VYKDHLELTSDPRLLPSLLGMNGLIPSRGYTVLSRLTRSSIRIPKLRFRSPFRMTSTLPRQPIFEAIAAHDLKRIAIVHNPSGRAFTYGELAHDVANAVESLKTKADGKSLEGERVAFLVENGYDYVGANFLSIESIVIKQTANGHLIVTLLSIFANNAVAVPLCTTHPSYELRYIIDQSEAMMLLSSEKFKDKAQDVLSEGTINQPIIAVEKILEGTKSTESIELVECSSNDGGLMLYTSGTTSRPVSLRSTVNQITLLTMK